MKKSFFIFILALIIDGCLPSLKVIESEYKIFSLTPEIAESREKDFFVYLPSGWFSTKDVNYNANEIWIVNENYSGVITIRKINAHFQKQSSNKTENLLSLSKVDLILHKRKYDQTFKLKSPPQLYQNGNLIYSSFEYGFGVNQFARVVLVEIDDEYFECVAYSTGNKYGNLSLFELYSAQESIVSSLKTR